MSAAKRRKNEAHGASRGGPSRFYQAPKERKQRLIIAAVIPQTGRSFAPLGVPGRNPQPDVIPVTALEAKRADYCQGESGTSKTRPSGPKSLRLKILPLSY